MNATEPNLEGDVEAEAVIGSDASIVSGLEGVVSGAEGVVSGAVDASNAFLPALQGHAVLIAVFAVVAIWAFS